MSPKPNAPTAQQGAAHVTFQPNSLDELQKLVPADITRSTGSEALSPLEREAEVLAVFNHPNIDVIHGVVEDRARNGAGRSVFISDSKRNLRFE